MTLGYVRLAVHGSRNWKWLQRLSIYYNQLTPSEVAYRLTVGLDQANGWWRAPSPRHMKDSRHLDHVARLLYSNKAFWTSISFQVAWLTFQVAGFGPVFLHRVYPVTDLTPWTQTSLKVFMINVGWYSAQFISAAWIFVLPEAVKPTVCASKDLDIVS